MYADLLYGGATMLYRITCNFSYSILNQKPLPIRTSSLYEFVGRSIYYPHCFVMREIGKELAPFIIVPEDKIQEISSISLESEDAFS